MAQSGKKIQGRHSDFQKQTSKGGFTGTDTEKAIWVFDKLDRNGDFAFNLDAIEKNGQLRDIMDKMIGFESMTWSEIKKATHDRSSKTKHHYLDLNGVSKAAEARIIALCDEGTDQIFSFALENKLRIIGLREGALFHVVWYDPDHKFYPSKK